jgi:hypothetical protein
MEARVRRILEDLEAVRENLLALSDDVWLSIDHNDPESLEEGVQFKRAYNEKMAAFDRSATDLSALIQQFTSVRLDAAEETGAKSQDDNLRLIRDLDHEEPHSLDEDFTFKRPHGFVLDGQAVTGVTTWRRLYELFCLHLLRKDPDRFHALMDHADFVSSRGHRSFAVDPKELRSAGSLADGLYTEINLSANGLRDMMSKLLAAFQIPTESLRIYLRQDRDADQEIRKATA